MEEERLKKIVLMGLDNSGKTSIVLNLLGFKHLQAFTSLNPTRGYDIKNLEILNSNYTLWDLGGQDRYRTDNLQNFEMFGKDLDKLIYVIDIQDNDRYELALDYLRQIIQLLTQNNLSPHISIFLHKHDPDLKIYKKDFDIQKVEDLIAELKEMLPKDFNYTIHETSIHTIFSKTDIFSNKGL